MSPARLCLLSIALLTAAAVDALFFPSPDSSSTSSQGACNDDSSFLSNFASGPGADLLERFFSIVNSSFVCIRVDEKQVQAAIKQCKLNLFYGPGANDFQSESLDNADKLVTGGYWKASRTLVLFLHGWRQKHNDNNSMEVVRAYVDNDTVMMMTLDWSPVTGQFYTIAVPMIPSTGVALATAIDKMARANASLNGVIIVGHSLGGHLAGYTAPKVKDVAVSLLVYLDVAGPLFFKSMIAQCLTPASGADAASAISLHSNWGGLGANEPQGCVDVMVNGGTALQPGCSSLDIDPQHCNRKFCSHMRVLSIWSAAIIQPGSVIARKCPSKEMFDAGNCSQAPTIDIAQPPSSSDCGLYYLTTNAADPFGKGMAGT